MSRLLDASLGTLSLTLITAYQIDDVLTLALPKLASVGGAAITFIVERDGGGVHQWDLHLSDFIQLGYVGFYFRHNRHFREEDRR